MANTFFEKFQEGYNQGQSVDNDKEKLSPKKKNTNLIILVIGIIGIFFVFKGGFGSSKPSACDCNKVMSYGDGAVDAAKRILGNSYGENFMRMSQNECALKYWDDIKKWQKIKD